MHPVLVAVLALSLLPVMPVAAQSTMRKLAEARMPLPESLTGDDVEVVTLRRARNLLSKKPFAIGEAQVSDVRRGWRKGDGSGIGFGDDGFGVRRVGSTEKFSFRLDEAESSWFGACAVVVKKKGIVVGSFSAERSIDEVVECDLVNQSEGAAWKLTLDTSIRPHVITADIVSGGTLSDGSATLEVVSRYDIDGTKLRGTMPTGFLFASGDHWVAALETSPKGAFHVRSTLAAPERRAVTAAAAALLLQTFLERSDIDD
jgi:hypothetical protein